jgi:hypothetical protein
MQCMCSACAVYMHAVCMHVHVRVRVHMHGLPYSHYCACQVGGAYTFSPASSVALTELCKLTLAVR